MRNNIGFLTSPLICRAGMSGMLPLTALALSLANASCVTKSENEPRDYQQRAKILEQECTFDHVGRRSPPSEWTCKSKKDGTTRALTVDEVEFLSFGSLSKHEIESEIRLKLSGIKNCYEEFWNKPGPKKNQDRDHGARYHVKFTINQAGKVTEATGDFLTDPKNSLLSLPEIIPLKECINGVALTYEFPPPRGGGIVQVKYPFVFSTDLRLSMHNNHPIFGEVQSNYPVQKSFSIKARNQFTKIGFLKGVGRDRLAIC